MSKRQPPPTDLVLPQNIDAEQALLGAILLNERVLHGIDSLQPEHFFEGLHQRIFASMRALAAAGRKISPVLLIPELGGEEVLPGMTGRQYVARLAAEATTIVNAPDYAAAIIDLAARRNIIAVAEELKAMAYRQGEEAAAAREIVERGVMTLMAADGAEGEMDIEPLHEIEAQVVDEIQNAMNTGVVPGISTGITFVDEITGPLEPCDLVVIGGRSGGGKTALVMQFLQNLSDEGIASGFFSLEMPGKGLAQRGLAARSGVPASMVSSLTINMEELETLVAAHRKGGKRHIDIIRQRKGRMSMQNIEMATAKLVATKGIKAIAIDHLQLIAGDAGNRYKGDKFDIIQDAVFRAKLLANRFGIVVFLLSQLRRNTEASTRFVNMGSVERPRMEELFGGDQIQQAADKVLLVHRPIYHLERMTAVGEEAQERLALAKNDWAGKAEILLDKRRNGRAPLTRRCLFAEATMEFKPINDFGGDEFR